jgi:hypothetical protein
MLILPMIDDHNGTLLVFLELVLALSKMYQNHGNRQISQKSSVFPYEHKLLNTSSNNQTARLGPSLMPQVN